MNCTSSESSFTVVVRTALRVAVVLRSRRTTGRGRVVVVSVLVVVVKHLAVVSGSHRRRVVTVVTHAHVVLLVRCGGPVVPSGVEAGGVTVSATRVCHVNRWTAAIEVVAVGVAAVDREVPSAIVPVKRTIEVIHGGIEVELIGREHVAQVQYTPFTSERLLTL